MCGRPPLQVVQIIRRRRRAGQWIEVQPLPVVSTSDSSRRWRPRPQRYMAIGKPTTRFRRVRKTAGLVVHPVLCRRRDHAAITDRIRRAPALPQIERSAAWDPDGPASR